MAEQVAQDHQSDMPPIHWRMPGPIRGSHFGKALPAPIYEPEWGLERAIAENVHELELELCGDAFRSLLSGHVPPDVRDRAQIANFLRHLLVLIQSPRGTGEEDRPAS